ncbi:structure-specific endonuclease subunit Slx1p [[Candida] railenensis]|uniref:Structure-specific endonuclease subunit Slx1p n=1 Tax=[Candida] railenensis TaxID=45579 RepID=A0A9P0QLC4_9ASCO|nr:structure-specific endonuclease subunit Slx1p [[Candida] railenensis]
MSIPDEPNVSIHTTPNLYTVYILQSIPKPRSIYIGSSPDPIRRLRQHNGELKAGAYRTSRDNFRPWKQLCIIHGFPSKIAALQFEHALQHPYQTRHISVDKRVSTSKTNGISVHHKLGNVRLLISSTFFRKFDLKVCMLDPHARDIWVQNKFVINIENDWTFSDSILDYLRSYSLKKKNEIGIFEKTKERILQCPIDCALCEVPINYLEEQPDCSIGSKAELDSLLDGKKLPLIAMLSCQCQLLAHLTCWGNRSGVTSDSIIPKAIECPACSYSTNWIALVRNATKLREYMLKDIVK